MKKKPIKIDWGITESELKADIKRLSNEVDVLLAKAKEIHVDAMTVDEIHEALGAKLYGDDGVLRQYSTALMTLEYGQYNKDPKPLSRPDGGRDGSGMLM
jgi:hypothetical protein